MRARHADAVAAITSLPLDRKVELLTGATYFTLHEEPALGLASIRLSDGPNGLRGLGSEVCAALLPNASLLAASWDEALVERMGELLGDEAEGKQVHVLLGPTINLHRTPLGGRLFEMFSEDPLLTGKLAAAYVRGVQSRSVAACLKHLIANESETDRTTVSSEVSEATLRELYLVPFEIAIAESDPWTVMAAYNDVNGTPATQLPFTMTDVLRDEWHWDGVVVSDWSATKSAAPAADAGLGIVMPGPQGPWGQALVDAVKAGEIDETVIDEHVSKLLLLADRVEALEPARVWRSAPARPEHRRDQLVAPAVAGMTVLKNDSVLPLRREATVALIGRHAVATVGTGGGAAEVFPPYVVSIADGLAELLPSVTVNDGVDVYDRLPVAQLGVLFDPIAQAPGMHLTAYAKDGNIRADRHCNVAKDIVVGDVARVVLTAQVALDKPAAVGVMGVGDWHVEIGTESADASLHITDGWLGAASLAPPAAPTGLLAAPGQTIVATVDVAGAFPHGIWGRWGLSAGLVPIGDDASLVNAERAAAAANVAVVVVGLTDEQETEGFDKTTLALPGRQDEMVRRTAAVASRTVVVVNAATPVLMPWIDEVDAVVWVGLPGQEAGHAVAAALVGDLEPTGRLVTTFPIADGATPAWTTTPTDGTLRYDEGPFIGYRGHAAGHAPEPLFWFGHGLGYSTWTYETVEVISHERARVTVRNSGERASREVVQVYLKPADVSQPTRLIGWSAVALAPNASANVEVDLDPRLLRRWSDGRWVGIGAGELLVARGLGDIRLRAVWSPV